MKTITNYTTYIPYFYFISVIAIWFTQVNQAEGIWAYPILLLGIPFVWQLLRPSRYLNFLLGILFVCISSYLMILFLAKQLQFMSSLNFGSINTILIPINLMMALWIIRNSLRRSF